MNIHEYQAKTLLGDYNVPKPEGRVAQTVADARSAASALGPGPWVVKAQIHAGGRGKAGGVRLVKTLEEVTAAAEALLGNPLVTHQTGPEGEVVHAVYVENATTDIAQELYLSFAIDRTRGCFAVIASAQGGMDIEEVAARTPDAIYTAWVDPVVGFAPFVGREVAFEGLGLTGEVAKRAADVILKAAQAFQSIDALMLEINPLVVTGSGQVLALDAKISLDENALFRHAEFMGFAEGTASPAEVEAARHGLTYVALDGTIGCMVNGAGLAMATMDIIHHYGGSPANFLDVGGGAPRERVQKAFEIILADARVGGILVNIFGGIMRCDVIAAGLVDAAKEMRRPVPIVVRLAGTKAAEGAEILRQSNLNITPAASLDEAARTIVQLVQGAAA